MTIQEYGLKFNQLSRYASHMVANSRAHMNKFLYGVSDLVKIECQNAMLLGDMNILSRLRVISLGNRLRRVKRLGLGTMTIPNRNWVVEVARRVSRSFQLQLLRQLVFHPLRIGMTRRVEHHALSLREAGTKTHPTFPKCNKNHPGECLAGKEGCFGRVQSGHKLRDCPGDCPSRKGQRGGNGRNH